jgi:hypothetical protein
MGPRARSDRKVGAATGLIPAWLYRIPPPMHEASTELIQEEVLVYFVHHEGLASGDAHTEANHQFDEAFAIYEYESLIRAFLGPLLRLWREVRGRYDPRQDLVADDLFPVVLRCVRAIRQNVLVRRRACCRCIEPESCLIGLPAYLAKNGDFTRRTIRTQPRILASVRASARCRRDLNRSLIFLPTD